MDLIKRTIDLARANVEDGGRPFACIISRGGEIVAEAVNLVAQTHDPTAHAEILAIRAAAAKLGTEHFTGCEFTILAHPCPMCLASAYWARISRIVYANTRDDAAAIGFDDAFLYEEMPKAPRERTLAMDHVPSAEAAEAFAAWMRKADKITY